MKFINNSFSTAGINTKLATGVDFGGRREEGVRTDAYEEC